MRRKPSQKVRSLKPRKAIPKANRARKAKNKLRAYGGEYANWIRAMVCFLWPDHDCDGPTHAHHTKIGGASYKADASTLAPVCAFHHDCWHTDGTFRTTHRTTLTDYAARLWTRWQEETRDD